MCMVEGVLCVGSLTILIGFMALQDFFLVLRQAR